MSNSPVYMKDANLDDPQQFAAWALSNWPGVEKSQPYPAAPAPLLPYHSQLLWDLGFRCHPELAVIKKVPGPKHLPVFIGVDEPDPEPEDTQAEEADLKALLNRVDPDLVRNLASLSPEERENELISRKAAFDEAIEVLRKIGGGNGHSA